MSPILQFVIVVVIATAMAWYGFKMEPHWVSKDGARFICRGQLIGVQGREVGRPRDYRCEIRPDGTVAAGRRTFLGRDDGIWKLMGRAPEQPRKRAVFLLSGGYAGAEVLVLRLPSSSRAVPLLDAASPR
jgi:hypothetical protein